MKRITRLTLAALLSASLVTAAEIQSSDPNLSLAAKGDDKAWLDITTNLPKTVTVDEIVTVSNTNTGFIDPSFLGFHYEKDIMLGTMFRTSNVNLINLYRLLGRNGILRMSGCRVDDSFWGGMGSAGSSKKLIMSGDVDEFIAFVKAVGWKVIYGVNGRSDKMDASIDEAKYALTKLGDTLYAFEYDNEPGDRVKYEEAWNLFRDKVGTSVPYAGPGTASVGWAPQFAKDLGSKLDLLTAHFYIGGGHGQTVDEMLATLDPGNGRLLTLEKGCKLMTDATEKYVKGGKWFFGEANNYSGGGSSNQSDRFGSALWVLEYLFEVAQHGCSGVSVVNDVYNKNTYGYVPIYCGTDNGGTVQEVRPEFYGLLLWSKIAGGTIETTRQTGSAGPGFHSYAVNNTDGTYSVVLANNSRTETVRATIQLPKDYQSASYIIMTAPSIDSKTGVTLGGSAVGVDGSWTPHPQSLTLSNDGKTVSVIVNTGSAVWIQFR